MAHLMAQVTEWKSPENARFLCWNVHQLWDNGEVTVNHCVEDEEWGSSEESEEIAHKEDYPADFFKTGLNVVISQTGSMTEEPL